MPIRYLPRLAGVLILTMCAPSLTALAADNAQLTIKADLDETGKPISSDLFGIFYEDLNYAADGGLYAELVQNRSFEYSPADKHNWRSLTCWDVVERDAGKAHLTVDVAQPLHPNNPHYAVFGVIKGEGVTGMRNSGFDGIPVKEGERFNVSLFARQVAGEAGPTTVRLETQEGDLLGECELTAPDSGWKKYEGQITATGADAQARLVVCFSKVGRTALDMVSLFPEDTFRGRKNGMRKDLAEAVAALEPKFVRFPGGCLVHGDGLDNMYRWKDTIGPLETRKAQRNIWRYHQTLGLGYFEYFQFCEDIGAKPLPVVPAAVCCQHSGARVTGEWGKGQRGIALRDMPAYVQEVLDLIEWANGPADSPWGSKRAAAGHPEPFNLQYIGIGNEDTITETFEERFEILFKAVRERHPNLTVIGTSGPFPDGEDFDRGWKFARSLGVPMIDEHYYRPPEWFRNNLHRYDSYDRRGAKVYVGEYAAHDRDRKNTWRSALAEAAFLTSLERNGDIVHFASYAPLLCKEGKRNWSPDLIYFTNTGVRLTLNYEVQKLFGVHCGDHLLPSTLDDSATQAEGSPGAGQVSVSVVSDSATRDVIVKLANLSDTPRAVRLDLAGIDAFKSPADLLTMSGDLDTTHESEDQDRVRPHARKLADAGATGFEAPAHSLCVLRLRRSP